MKEILSSPDLITVSLIFSVLFLVGVVRFFYQNTMYSHITIYSAIYYVLSFFSLKYFLYLSGIPYTDSIGSDIFVLNNLTIFLAFGLLATHGILPILTQLSSVILIFLISGCLLPGFYFMLHFGFFAHLELVDQGKVSFLFLVSGSMIWFFEVFFKQHSLEERTVNVFDASFLFYLGLPLSLLVGFSNHETFEIYPLFAKSTFSFFAVLLGMYSVDRKPDMKNGSFILAFLTSVNFIFVSLDSSVLVQLPICYSLGIFIPLASVWLENRSWSRYAIVVLLATLVSGIFGHIFAMILIPDTLWPHSPLVMLGVQTLYVLSVFLVSTFIASTVYFFPKRSGTDF